MRWSQRAQHLEWVALPLARQPAQALPPASPHHPHRHSEDKASTRPTRGPGSRAFLAVALLGLASLSEQLLVGGGLVRPVPMTITATTGLPGQKSTGWRIGKPNPELHVALP